MPKTVDELTFTDDGMFQAVMHDPNICAELIERLLHICVKQINYPKLEKRIAPFYTSKGIRLDVYLKDEDKVIDIEIQNYPQEALGKRTRYYSAMIDMDNLMKGQDYTELKDSYILFICKQDPFHDEKDMTYGLPCYTFHNVCIEDNTIKLHDNSLKVIYNASAYEIEKDEKIRDFLYFIHTNNPGEDDFNKRLSEQVEKIKENEKFRRDYAAMNLHDRDLIRITKREALAEGAKQKAVEAAIMLVQKYNATPETAAKDMNAPLELILEGLKQKNQIKSIKK